MIQPMRLPTVGTSYRAFDDLQEGESASDTFFYVATDSVETVRGEVIITINGLSDPKSSLNPVVGTSSSDYLVGTDNADIIHSLGGSYDRSAGGLGADIFAFGSEALNGARERDVILDYEVGVDAIMLTVGATVGSIRQTSTGAVIFLGGDLDAIYVQGEGVLPGNLTFVPKNILFA